MKGSGDFSIGSKVWPGTSKLIEETGELQQVLGKLIATAGDTDHWSGDLRLMMIDELGDSLAAIDFFTANLTIAERNLVHERAEKKLSIFRKWHAEQNIPHSVLSERANTAERKCKIISLAARGRPHFKEQPQELDAATEWLLSELRSDTPVSLFLLRASAAHELKRPRDALHKRWAECFLKETEGYTKEAEEREI